MLGTISVVLPNHNHANYLTLSISRLLSQLRPEDELIVIDDGSTDHSREIIRTFVERDDRVRFHENEHNYGVIACLNHGLFEAKSAFVYFGSADDLVELSTLEILRTQLTQYPKLGACSGEFRLISDNGRTRAIRPVVRPSHRTACFTPAEVREMLNTSDHWISTPAALFRRTAVLSVGGFDPELHSATDSFMATRIALSCGFCFVPQVLASVRSTPLGYSRRVARDLDRVAAVLERGTRLIREDGLFPPGYTELFTRRFRFSISRLALEETTPNIDLLTETAQLTPAESRFFTNLVCAGGAGKLAAFAYLVWKFHPTSAFRVIITALYRKFHGVR